MKSDLLSFMTAAVLLCLGCPAADAATMFTVNMDGSQETTPTASALSASGTLTLVDLGGGQFRWDFSLTFNDGIQFGGNPLDGYFQATGLHIHNAARGANGAVVFGLRSPDHDFDNDIAFSGDQTTTTISGQWDAGDGAVVGNINTFGPTLLAAGAGDTDFYFNLHTSANSGGEIRGQIVAVPEPGVPVMLLLSSLHLALRRDRRMGVDALRGIAPLRSAYW